MPSIIVIHYTAMQSAEAALQRLCDPSAEVSAHYLIDLHGGVTQMVAEDQRAWHAGVGEWRGHEDINSRSVGIELDNTGAHPFPESQMAALEDLIAGILSRWSILPENVIGHSDMAPGRKIDPGPRFDWARLARRGLAGPIVPPEPLEGFETTAVAAGYTAQAERQTLLSATRLRFAPWRDGPLCEADFRLCHDI